MSTPMAWKPPANKTLNREREVADDDIDMLRALIEDGCKSITSMKHFVPARIDHTVEQATSAEVRTIGVRTSKVQGKWAVVIEGKNGSDGEIALQNAPLHLLLEAPSILLALHQQVISEHRRFYKRVSDCLTTMENVLDVLHSDDGDE